MAKKIIDRSNAFDYHKEKRVEKNYQEKRKEKKTHVAFVSGKDFYSPEKNKNKKMEYSQEKTEKWRDDSTENDKYKKKKEEVLYCGVHACHAVFQQRKKDIIKVYVTKGRMREFGELLKYCSSKKSAYRVVDDKDLEKLTGSMHHEGIAVLMRMGKMLTLSDLNPGKPILWMDGVVNPHNIGTMMRIMAHFGWQNLAVTGTKTVISPAIVRMSEGGSEFVRLYGIESVRDFALWAKKNGYRLLGTSSHSKVSLYQYAIPEKTIFVVGQEAGGICHEVMDLLDESLLIPGTGNVESLNVSVAGGIFLSEYARQHNLGK